MAKRPPINKPRSPTRAQVKSAAGIASKADITLDAMRPIVHSIAAMVGRNCEVVLHDFRTPSASVIEIAGNLTDREIGAPVNEINNWLLSHGKDVRIKEDGFIRTTRGRTLKTSRTLFRGDDGKAFGALCINIDVTDMMSVIRDLADLAGVTEIGSVSIKLNDDIAYVVQSVITAEEARSGRRLNAASRHDRVTIFRALEANGVFKLKRAVPRLAQHFRISRATIYSYLNHKDVG
jgi:predicted transcriptional regulator YheO